MNYGFKTQNLLRLLILLLQKDNNKYFENYMDFLPTIKQLSKSFYHFKCIFWGQYGLCHATSLL